MNLILRRFYQSVDLANPEKVNYFLVLETEQGNEILLPVPQATTEALVQKLYAQGPKAEDVEDEPEPEADEEPEEQYEEELEEEVPQEEDLDEEPKTVAKRVSPLTADDLADLEPAGLGIFAAHPRHMKKKVPTSEDEVPSL